MNDIPCQGDMTEKCKCYEEHNDIGKRTGLMVNLSSTVDAFFRILYLQHCNVDQKAKRNDGNNEK